MPENDPFENSLIDPDFCLIVAKILTASQIIELGIMVARFLNR